MLIWDKKSQRTGRNVEGLSWAFSEEVGRFNQDLHGELRIIKHNLKSCSNESIRLVWRISGGCQSRPITESVTYLMSQEGLLPQWSYRFFV